MDHTVRTIKGIVLRSVRSACGNGLPYICHLVLMCNSFNNSIPPFFNYKSQPFEFTGISLHIKWCLKALFANWLNKILKIRSVTCTVNVANILFVCLVARPLTFFGEEVDGKNLIQ